MKDLKEFPIVSLVENVEMRKMTTYRVGGNARGMFLPKNTDELIEVLKYVRNNKIPYKILGKGSNVIFNDSGFSGYIIRLDSFDQCEIFGREITVGAGYSLPRLAMKACLSNLSGLEFASGIPGTVGGAIFMNAGAYKSDMGYVVQSVKVLTPEYEIITMNNKECAFHYRTSFFHEHPDYICLEAHFVLQYGKKEAILTLMNDRKKRRIDSQPLDYPSAGSVFRNPEGDSAGRIIESLGLKGMRIGDAQVSLKHANFIINVGQATGEDIKALILKVQEIVKEKTGILLKIEQEFVE